MKLNKIKKIQSINKEKFEINLVFQDGFKGKVSLSDIFENPKGLAAEVIRGNFFDKCFIEGGALAWPNGLEFCADSLRIQIEEKQKVA